MDKDGQSGMLLENDAVMELLNQLKEHRPDAGRDYLFLIGQIEHMGRQLDNALMELAEVRAQLQAAQKSPMKRYVSHMTDLTESRIQNMRDHLAEIKERVVENAKETMTKVKQTGVKALDKTFSVIGMKKMLETMQKDVAESVKDVGKTIEKVEAVGQELRSVGSHLKNAGRVAIGKERADVDGGAEGRFQSGILLPLRLEQKILGRMDNLTQAAIESVERLERSAGRVSEEKQTDKEGAGKGRKEKPSVVMNLHKNQAAVQNIPALKEKAVAQEAAL